MRSRDDVLDAALSTLNADPTASMAEIAAGIGIGRATLHRHVATREALLHELGLRSLERWAQTQAGCDMVGATTSGDAATLAACLRANLLGCVDDAAVFGFTLTDPTMLADPEMAARTRVLHDTEVALLAAAQEAGVVRRDLPAAWLSHLVLGLLVAARQAEREGDVARRDLPDLVLTSFLEGAAPR